MSGALMNVLLIRFINRKYNLRKVMVNGDIPPRVKKDAHAVILEFIRSRPPLRKVIDTLLIEEKHLSCDLIRASVTYQYFSVSIAGNR